jgi:hypothetical protein
MVAGGAGAAGRFRSSNGPATAAGLGPSSVLDSNGFRLGTVSFNLSAAGARGAGRVDLRQ